jgi:hypothetical protein
MVDLGGALLGWWRPASSAGKQSDKCPALTRLVGVDELQPAFLRRIWACCEPSEVTHLEAWGSRPLAAMGVYMLQRPEFRALRSITLGGDDCQAGHHEPAELADVFTACFGGRAPNVEELGLYDWRENMGTIGPLGGYIGEGKLPMLSKLKLYGCKLSKDDFCALLDGVAALEGGLRDLCLDTVRLAQESVGDLAVALRGGGGLGRLETLKLLDAKGLYRMSRDPILRALADGAPCSQTLKKLALFGCSFTQPTLQTLFQALGSGRFPHLAHLQLRDRTIDAGLMGGLVDTLVALVHARTPARLVGLDLGGPASLARSMVELARAFAAGALACLTAVTIEAPKVNGSLSDVLDSWKKMGSKIKLTRLGLITEMPPQAASSLLEALKDPDSALPLSPCSAFPRT